MHHFWMRCNPNLVGDSKIVNLFLNILSGAKEILDYLQQMIKSKQKNRNVANIFRKNNKNILSYFCQDGDHSIMATKSHSCFPEKGH